MVYKELFILGFSYSLSRVLAQFRDSPYNINCWGSHTVVRISGLEIEEQSYMNVQISLCKFMKMNML
jgi:hypothetical protein